MTSQKSQLIAFYLPQYYPIPENDEWWGKDFTEWTNVGKAIPLFRGHRQPKVPADLGYYDLRVRETREAQAQLARDAGIEGFCYWHYWFGNGKRLLERPFNEVLESGKPEFPFCLGWANHSWKAKNWNAAHKGKDRLLIEQEYPGDDDYTAHFNYLLKAFQDKRYIYVDDRPLLLIWGAKGISDFQYLSRLWNGLAQKNGLKGIFFVSYCTSQGDAKQRIEDGYDGVTLDLMFESYWWSSHYKLQKWYYYLYRSLLKDNPRPRLIDFNKYAKYSLEAFSEMDKKIMPCILPNYDHSPRSGRNGYILHNGSPAAFGKFLSDTLDVESSKGNNTIFIKSWNEWGEGNYLEPDLEFKDGYLKAIRKAMDRGAQKNE